MPGINNFGDSGAAAPAQPLGSLAALTLLVMHGHGVGAASAESLAHTLRHPSRLACLRFREKDFAIGDPGAGGAPRRRRRPSAQAAPLGAGRAGSAAAQP